MRKKKRLIKVLVLLVIAVLSVTLLTGVATSKKVTSYSTNYLDDRKTTVLELSGAAIAASAAVTVFPNDIGTPIADKLADLSMVTMLILCAIFLEKYLVTLSGIAAFRFLIPAVCLLLIADEFIKQPVIQRVATKILVFALAIFFLVPGSVLVCKVIDRTYDYNMTAAIEEANESAQEVQENTESGNIIERFIESVKGGVTGLLKKFERILNNLIESFAVMIVTCCIIPILMLLILVWLFKTLLQVDFHFGDMHFHHMKHPRVEHSADA